MLPIKNILIGAVLFGTGATAGYFTAKHVLQKSYQEDLEEIQEWYREKLAESLYGGLDSQDESNTFGPPYIVEDEPEPESSKDGKNTNVRKIVDYRRFSKPDLGSLLEKPTAPEIDDDPDDIPDVDDPEYEAEIERRSDAFIEAQRDARNNGGPYMVEHDEFQEAVAGDVEGYRTQDLYYYRKDRTLCEDDDQEVEDVEEIVGLDFEEVLAMQTQCFVRNDRLRCFYHIYRIEGSYEKAVRGVSETPNEREYRIMGRRKNAIDND